MRAHHNATPESRRCASWKLMKLLFAEIDARGSERDELALAAHKQLGEKTAEADARATAHEEMGNELRAENERLSAQVRRVELVRCWTNEDGKRFVFADDLGAALNGGDDRG